MKIRTGLALGAAAAVLVVTVPLTAKLLGVFDGLPWETETTERSQPSVLNSLEDLADFHAARGNYQVAVTIEEDSPVAPSFLAGEESTLLAQGSVDAVVDFSALDDDAIRIGPEGEVTVTVPEPELVDAQVDPEHSEVMNHERGLLDRVTSMFSDNEISEGDLYVLAGDELNEAASDSELQDRAQANTTEMLEGMLGELGYKDVTVQFAGAPVTP